MRGSITSISRPDLRLRRTLLFSLSLAFLGRGLLAQRPDTLRSNAGNVDTAVARLAPLEVRASIAPAAGPTVGSGIPARVTQIEQQSLTQWRPRMLDQALAPIAGVSSYDDLGSPLKTSISVRGFSVGPTVGLPEGVSVFVDGVRQNEPDAQEVNFDLLPMDFVKRIELLSGTASLLGPNGIGGAINLITDRGDGAPHGSIEVGGGSFGNASLRATAAGSTGNGWSYFAGASGDRANGWRAATSSHGTRAFAHLSKASDTRGLDLETYAARSDARSAGSLPESIFDVSPRVNFTAGDLDALSMAQLSASGFVLLGGGRMSATAFVRGARADRFNANQPPDDDVRGLTASGSEGLNVDWRRSFASIGHGLDLRAGTDVSADQVRVRLFDLPPSGGGADSLTTDVTSPRGSAAGYLLADAHVARATLSLGARLDLIHTPFNDRLDTSDVVHAQSYRRITPRGGISVDLGHGASAYASVGSSFRAPALLELGCADPNAACPLPFALGDDPPLAPVSATTLEVGGQSLLGSILVRGSLYRTNVRHEIFFIASPGALLSGYFTNIDRTRRGGAELDAQGMAGARIRWYAGYALTRATFESPTQIFSIRSDSAYRASPLAGDNGVRPGDALPLVPADQFKAGASIDLTTAASVGIDARRIGRQWLRGDEANQTAPLAPYQVVDLRADVDRGPWSIGVVVRNALDSHVPIFGTFNENRRTGALERFLTPLQARTIDIEVGRTFGAMP